jgi:hypothetical protein
MLELSQKVAHCASNKVSTAAEMVHVGLRPGPSDRRTKPPSSAACLELSRRTETRRRTSLLSENQLNGGFDIACFRVYRIPTLFDARFHHFDFSLLELNSRLQLAPITTVEFPYVARCLVLSGTNEADSRHN